MASVPESGYLVAGRYRLVDQIGRGAMGIVWRGQDQLLAREVAVKQIVLPPLTSQAQAEASFQRTLREARTAARLSHPSVVTVFDVVEEQGAPWIVMELVRARPLDQVIAEDGPLTPAQAAQLGLSLLDALATAHAADVLHRDVKPSNVLIRPDGKAVLTDFGIATIQGDPSLTQAGMVVGTPGFAPPERVRGEAATPASDLWSLGATLYAAVEGRGPFDRAGGSAAIVASVATEPAPRAPSAGPLGAVIDALLQADPAERPDVASTAQMLADAWAAAKLPDPARGLLASDLAGSPRSERDGVEATTATQVVAVPIGADQPGEESGASSAAAGLAGAGLVVGAGLAGEAALARTMAMTAASTAEPASAHAGPAQPGLAQSGLAQSGLAQPGAAQPGAAQSGSASAIGVVPDLMATPVFADLKMPDAIAVASESPQLSASSPGEVPGAPGGPPGASRDRGGDSGMRRFVFGRRGLVLVAPLAVIAIVVGVASLLLHGFPTSLAQGLANAPHGSGSSAAHTAPAGHSRPLGHHPGSQRSGGSPGGQPAPGTPPPGGTSSPSGTPAHKPTPTPSASTTQSPSPTPTPTPTPSPSPVLPAGYAWYSVTGSSVGTTAGFRVAAPKTWEMIPDVTTTIRPLTGAIRLTIDMAQFAVQGPVREAHHLQSVAILRGTYRQYHLVSILAVTYRGRPAATWTFWWKPSAQGKVIDVTKLIYTAITPAGPQPYILSMSAPAPSASWANHVFAVAKRTFQPRP